VLGKPVGVGVMSAALKTEQLGAAGYAAMIANTTKLNTPGPELAALAGVHALTDVTGFGLAGHCLELAKGAGVQACIDWARVPLLASVRELAAQGFVTGASGRNWAGYGADVALPSGFAAPDQALLTDPQTSGGLLVSCEPAAVGDVLAVFRRHGFDGAAVVLSPDTGPLHLAVALRTPVISLLGYTNPKRVGPYDFSRDLMIDAYGDPDEDYPLDMTYRLARMERITVADVRAMLMRWQERYRQP
jgi:selenide,water dikinase